MPVGSPERRKFTQPLSPYVCPATSCSVNAKGRGLGEPGLSGLVTSHLPTAFPLESLTAMVNVSCSGLSSVNNLKATPRSEPVEVNVWLTVVVPLAWEVVLGYTDPQHLAAREGRHVRQTHAAVDGVLGGALRPHDH